LGDEHLVCQSNWPDFGQAQKFCTDTALLITNESDALGVGHPVDVPFDGFNDGPDVFD